MCVRIHVCINTCMHTYTNIHAGKILTNTHKINFKKYLRNPVILSLWDGSVGKALTMQVGELKFESPEAMESQASVSGIIWALERQRFPRASWLARLADQWALDSIERSYLSELVEGEEGPGLHAHPHAYMCAHPYETMHTHTFTNTTHAYTHQKESAYVWTRWAECWGWGKLGNRDVIWILSYVCLLQQNMTAWVQHKCVLSPGFPSFCRCH